MDAILILDGCCGPAAEGRGCRVEGGGEPTEGEEDNRLGGGAAASSSKASSKLSMLPAPLVDFLEQTLAQNTHTRARTHTPTPATLLRRFYFILSKHERMRHPLVCM